MRKFYRTLALVFTLMLTWQGVAWGQMETIQQGVILHCFDWKYTDIQAELQSIKNAGFTAIQTSPAQKNYTGSTSWNTLYRPRNPSEIGPNTLGTKAELQALCTAAHALGLKIIVDVVANHADGAAYVDSEWQSSDLYHGWGNVTNWSDRSQVTHGDVGGLRDINTGSSTVQAKMKAYIQALKSIGVDGIRWDAAKHIGLPSEGDNFWSTVPDQTMFNYGEILDNTGGNDATLIPEYLKYMSITDNTYGTNMLLSAAKQNTAPDGAGSWAFTYSSNKFVYWGESHDTYCNSGGASVGVSQAQVDRAYALAASHNQIPALYLSRPSDNSTTNGPSTNAGTKGSTHFTSTAITAVNNFHNAMDGKGDYYTKSGNVASVTRYGGGAIVVNFGGSGSVSIANGGGYATPGTYTDQVSGNTWTITSSTISGTTDGTGIAVLYNGAASTAAGLTLSPNGGTFTSTSQSVTLKPNDNTSSYWYQVGSGSKVTGQTGTKEISVGESLSYGESVTLSWGATNSDGDETTGSATYTKQDPNATIKVYVKASTAPYIYVWYTDGTSTVEPNGSWSSVKAMTSSSTGWYVYTAPAGASSINFILLDSQGGNKLTDDVTNVTSDVYYAVSGSSASVTTARPTSSGSGSGSGTTTTYTPQLDSSDEISCFFETSYDNVKAWVWDSNNNNTNYTGGSWPGQNMTNMGKTSDGNNVFKWTYSGSLTNIPTGVIFTHDGETKFNTTADGVFTNHGYYTESSALTSTKTITDTKSSSSADEASVTFSLSSGSSFTTDTYSVTLTPVNATSASYTYNGTTKAINGATTITIGETETAPATITITWSATNSAGTTSTGTVTYYKKKSGSGTSTSTGLASYYKTNPNGAGQKKTITVDGDLSDWDATDVIAQGAANDDPRVYRDNSMYEVPIDLYTLYGAYDDTNVYLAWEMTNVQDVVAPNDDYPLSQGILYQTMNVPFWIGFQTGNSSTLVKNAKTPWDDKYITFQNGVNKMLAISTNGANGPYVYDGNGTQELAPTSAGVTFKWGTGIKSSNIWGINGAYGTNNNRTVGDMKNESADWVDFNTKSHSSSTLDFHYEMSIPLADLGITASDVAKNGLGVMLVATMGASGMDCLPYDLSMNDNADQADTQSQAFNSLEKSDADVITSPFAFIGAVNNSGTSPSVTTPTVTADPASGKSFTESLEVTLTAHDATSATYTYNGTTKTFTGSTTVTIGATETAGSAVTITWTATNSGASSNGSFVYTKVTSSDETTRLLADTVKITQGGTADLVVSMQNVKDGGAFDFTVALPDGIEADADNGYFTLGEMFNDGSIGILKTYQSGAIVFSGAPKANLNGNTGSLVTIHLKASSTATAGSFDEALSNITICKVGGGELKQTIGSVPNSTFKVIVSSSSIKGDVNGDGVVDILDVLLAINAIGSSSSQYDVTGDGVVDITDVVYVINNIGTNN